MAAAGVNALAAEKMVSIWELQSLRSFTPAPVHLARAQCLVWKSLSAFIMAQLDCTAQLCQLVAQKQVLFRPAPHLTSHHMSLCLQVQAFFLTRLPCCTKPGAFLSCTALAPDLARTLLAGESLAPDLARALLAGESLAPA